MHDELWTTTRQTSLRLRAYEASSGEGGLPTGEAPTIVALHGLVAGTDGIVAACGGDDPYARLAGHGCRVLTLDWPGHGRSGGQRGHLPYRLAMDAAAAAVDVAQQRWGGPIALFGAGLGGILSVYAAIEDRRIGAVAAASVLDLRDVAPVLGRSRRAATLPVAARAAGVLPPRAARRIRVPLSGVLAGRDLSTDPVRRRLLLRHPQAVRRATLAGLASIFARPDDKPDIRALGVPLLAAVGTEDAVVPESAVRAFTQAIGAHAQPWVLPGAGHDLLVGHHRALVPAVAAFVRDHVGASDAAG